MCYFSERDIIVQVRIDRVMAELPEFCQCFLFYCKLKLSRLTACSYLYIIRQFFSFYSNLRGVARRAFTIHDLKSITAADIEKWLASYAGKIETNSIIYKYSVIKTFLGYYYTRRMIQQNAAEQIIMPKLEEKPIILLHRSETSKLFTAVDDYKQRYHIEDEVYDQKYRLRDKTILIFFLSTGVRISELVGLDIKHINLADASFTVRRKGGKIETLYMTDELYDQLCMYMKSINASIENAPLFSSRNNPRISDGAVRLIVRKYVKLAGIRRKISPHKLRSTFGTNLYRKTRDIFAVAQCLGHASVNTTRKHYVSIDNDIKREAVRGFAIAQ